MTVIGRAELAPSAVARLCGVLGLRGLRVEGDRFVATLAVPVVGTVDGYAVLDVVPNRCRLKLLHARKRVGPLTVTVGAGKLRVLPQVRALEAWRDCPGLRALAVTGGPGQP